MVGCRFSLYPLTDAFVSIILDALKGGSMQGLDVRTDDVSTYVSGDEDAMLAFVQQALVAASKRTPHVVCTLLLSRGCPGEEMCEVDATAPRAAPHVRRTDLHLTGVRAAAHFSLYPLGIVDYMDVIYREIGKAKEAGTCTRAEHFASRLEGDVAEIFATIPDCWDRAEVNAGHVVAHATISVGSPSLVNG